MGSGLIGDLGLSLPVEWRHRRGWCGRDRLTDVGGGRFARVTEPGRSVFLKVMLLWRLRRA